MADTYTVQQGDCLWKISKRYGVSFQELKSLNPVLAQRKPPYAINPGDVIKLPPKQQNGNSRSIVQQCPIDRCKVVEIKLDSTGFRLCTPSTFKVSKYTCTPPPTDDEKKCIRWFVRDAKTKEDLIAKYASAIEQNGEELKITCVPFDWHERNIEIGAQFDNPPPNAMYAGIPSGDDVLIWISLIQKAEKEYPSWTLTEMIAAMRRLAFTDSRNFRLLFGGSNPGKDLLPKGSLTKGDVDQLINWTRHDPPTHPGMVTDALGEQIAGGHVLTGITGGMTRNRSLDPTPIYSLTAGERIDNLYAVTISGDLGQAAVFVKLGKQAKPYIGSHGEATEPELVGDIDGFLIGDSLSGGTSSLKLGEILLDYYCPCSQKPVNFRKRFKSFKAGGMGDLKKEISSFAVNFMYAEAGKWKGVTTSTDSECADAYTEFDTWLTGKAAAEK